MRRSGPIAPGIVTRHFKDRAQRHRFAVTHFQIWPQCYSIFRRHHRNGIYSSTFVLSDRHAVNSRGINGECGIRRTILPLIDGGAVQGRIEQQACPVANEGVITQVQRKGTTARIYGKVLFRNIHIEVGRGCQCTANERYWGHVQVDRRQKSFRQRVCADALPLFVHFHHPEPIAVIKVFINVSVIALGSNRERAPPKPERAAQKALFCKLKPPQHFPILTDFCKGGADVSGVIHIRTAYE